MNNHPEIQLGLAAVSRNCFPADLSIQRRKQVAKACQTRKLPVVELETLIENESQVETLLAEASDKNVNALTLYLGNFGPEGPSTQLAADFPGPVMLAAAAEERGDNLVQGRGDAYCGLLNASYNTGLRRLRLHIPAAPVGTPDETANRMAEFIPVARVLLGIRNLKIFAFGPRPEDFYACHAPIQPLMDLGVEVMENSELDLLHWYRSRSASRVLN